MNILFLPNLSPIGLIYLFIFKFILFIYFWLHWVFIAFSSCSKWGLIFVAVRRLLIAVSSLVVEHGL